MEEKGGRGKGSSHVEITYTGYLVRSGRGNDLHSLDIF